jgi:uncharacterized membrane protein YphA (DoxX/SURF4 family)
MSSTQNIQALKNETSYSFRHYPDSFTSFPDLFYAMEAIISKLKQNRFLQIFTIFLRYVLGASFVFASILKIEGVRFTPESGKNAPIDSLPHFFETMFQAGAYWNFIGWGQMVVGFLMMSQLFSTLGAVAFFPIILNIFVITISFDSSSVLFITSLMVLGNIFLLVWDWNKIKFTVSPFPKNYLDDNHEFSKRKIWFYLGLVFFVGVIFIRKVVLNNY